MSSLRSALVMALGFAMLFIGFAGTAAAQDDSYPVVLPAPQPDPGSFGTAPGVLSGTQAGLLGEPGAFNLSDNAAAFQRPLAAAAAGAGGGTGGGTGELAFTGAESSLLAAGGMTLVLAGGAAVVVSRRRD